MRHTQHWPQQIQSVRYVRIVHEPRLFSMRCFGEGWIYQGWLKRHGRIEDIEKRLSVLKGHICQVSIRSGIDWKEGFIVPDCQQVSFGHLIDISEIRLAGPCARGKEQMGPGQANLPYVDSMNVATFGIFLINAHGPIFRWIITEGPIGIVDGLVQLYHPTVPVKQDGFTCVGCCQRGCSFSDANRYCWHRPSRRLFKNAETWDTVQFWSKMFCCDMLGMTIASRYFDWQMYSWIG